MIDTKELRRLAQAATPHVGHACKYQDAHWLREGHVDFENADLFIASERPQEDAAFYAAANPTTVIEILDRLEDAESDALEQARLNGMGSEREAALMAKLEAAEKERDALRIELNEIRYDAAHQKALAESALRVAEGWEGKCGELRAKIEAMEKQEPVGVLHVGSYYGEELQEWEFEANQCACDKLNEVYVSNPTSLPLYALPGAQTQGEEK